MRLQGNEGKAKFTMSGAGQIAVIVRQNRARVVIALLGSILVAATLIRLYPLSARSFWFDEAFTWRLIDYPWLEMLERATRDNSPPFYYFVLKAWSEVFGTSPVALRSLSLLFGLVTVMGTYLFCVEAFGRKTSDDSKDNGTSILRAQGIGLLAAALVALSALQIRYSWEARMYALAAALTIFSSWALLRALRGGSRWADWLLYAFFAILLAYTHYYGLFTLGGQAVFTIFFLLAKVHWDLNAFCRLPEGWRGLTAAALVFAAWLPWLPVFLHQAEQVRNSFWAAPVSAWDLAAISYRMFTIPEFVPRPSGPSVWLVAGACLFGLWFLRRNGRAGDWLVLCSTVSPFVLCVLASRLGTQAVTLRYFVLVHVFVLIGLAVLVFRIPFLVERCAVVGVVLAGFLLVALESYDVMDLANRPGARAAAEFIERERRPHEPVIVSSPVYYDPLFYHGKKPADFFVYVNGNPIPHYYGTAVLSPEELISQQQLLRLRSRRVWVVNMASQYWGMKHVPVPANWIEIRAHSFPDLRGVGDFHVLEYEVREEPARKLPIEPSVVGEAVSQSQRRRLHLAVAGAFG
jgi:mannosyltransferase